MSPGTSTFSAGGCALKAATAMSGNLASEKFTAFQRSKTVWPSCVKNSSIAVSAGKGGIAARRIVSLRRVLHRGHGVR